MLPFHHAAVHAAVHAAAAAQQQQQPQHQQQQHQHQQENSPQPPQTSTPLNQSDSIFSHPASGLSHLLAANGPGVGGHPPGSHLPPHPHLGGPHPPPQHGLPHPHLHPGQFNPAAGGHPHFGMEHFRPRFLFRMPRVVPNQKEKYESDDLMKRHTREGEVRHPQQICQKL